MSLVHKIILEQQNKIDKDNKNENNYFFFLPNIIKTKTCFFKDLLFIWTSIFNFQIIIIKIFKQTSYYFQNYNQS